MTTLPTPTEPLPDLVEESFGEAAFLWRRWERELTSLTRNLEEIRSWTEDRLHGAIDGVCVAGDGAIDLATTGLQSEEREQIALSAAVLASATSRRAIDALIAAIAAADGDRLNALIRGLEVLGSNQGLRAAASALAARGPAGAGALCRLKAFRRAAIGNEMMTAFAAEAPEIQADAVRAALFSNTPERDGLIETALHSDNPAVRLAAVETGIGRGLPHAREIAVGMAARLDEQAAAYLKLLALFGTTEDHETVYAALRLPALQREAIWAVGHIGTARAAEVCLAGMRHDAFARASAEAYCWITGADLVRDCLERQEPPVEVPAFEDDDLDADLVPTAEALWPLPDADAARRHWLERSSSFAADVRHVQGRPVTGGTLLAMIETGPMLRRPDLVLELRARTRGAYDVEPRAFTARQQTMMAAARAAVGSTGGR